MQEIINKRKIELEEQLKNDIMNRAMIQEQITSLTTNVEIIDKQITSIRVILGEFNNLSHPLTGE